MVLPVCEKKEGCSTPFFLSLCERWNDVVGIVDFYIMLFKIVLTYFYNIFH